MLVDNTETVNMLKKPIFSVFFLIPREIKFFSVLSTFKVCIVIKNMVQ